jgi:hypothetical protein
MNAADVTGACLPTTTSCHAGSSGEWSGIFLLIRKDCQSWRGMRWALGATLILQPIELAEVAARRAVKAIKSCIVDL